ncbi:MAG: hypothetical protein ACNS62_12675 [Candidatus Cyclobacteriaceae bacterium M3_2C_046]
MIDWFGNKTKTKKSHLKNLLEVALADGNLDKNEVLLLHSLGKRFNISPEEIDQIKNNPQTINFHPPKSNKERFNQIYDLVCMMMIDGQINRHELDICKLFALKLGFMPLIVDDFVRIITDNVSRGISVGDAYLEVSKLLN